MFENEYILRLIKAGINTALALFAGKDAVKSDVDIENDNFVFSKDKVLEFIVRKYTREGRLNEAEDVLFEAIEAEKSKKNLEVALAFYEEIDNLDEATLIKYNFSKAEIRQGREDIKKIFEKS